MNSHVFKTSSSTLLAPEPNGRVPDWIQLFPSGTFSGRDGRGPFTCDAAAVVAQTQMRNGSLDIPIDYDHQIEFSSSNGQPAPAAGWITALEARDTGVWGYVEWTDKGKAHVVAREYRYVSPVYYYEQDGTILSIESVALTNVPNLNMKALASCEMHGQNPFTGDSSMSFLKTIASALGMTDAEPTEAAVEAAARQLVHVMSTVAQTVKSSDATPDDLVKAVQSVAMRAEKPDATQYVPIGAFKVGEQVGVRRGVYAFDPASGDGLTRMNTGAPCYAADDCTVKKTATDNAPVAGIVFDVTPEGVWVKI